MEEEAELIQQKLSNSNESLNSSFVIIPDTVQFPVQVGTSRFFSKVRLIQILDDRIQLLDQRNNTVRFIHEYRELIAIAKSLRTDSQVFVCYFVGRPDEEWFSNDRDRIIAQLSQKYELHMKKKLDIYGISTVSLDSYLRSGKDITKGFDRLPGK